MGEISLGIFVEPGSDWGQQLIDLIEVFWELAIEVIH